MMIHKGLLSVLFLASSPAFGERLGHTNTEMFVVDPAEHRQLSDENGYFLVSQVSSSKDWCIIGPDLDYPYDEATFYESKLRFTLCEPAFDGYREGGRRQLFELRSDKKIHSIEYPDLCMIVNDGESLGEGVMRLDDCDSKGKLNKFRYSTSSKRIHLDSKNNYCVTNEGTTADDGDAMYVKRCGRSRRFKFDFVEARFYWQIIVGYDNVALCMMPENGDVPQNGDKVYIDECGSPEDGWRFEKTSTGAFVFHSRLDDNICMQLGHGGGDIISGTKMRYKPCDRSNPLQRFDRIFSSDEVHYKIQPEPMSDWCVVPQGATTEKGDIMIATECSSAATEGGVDTFYDDEA